MQERSAWSVCTSADPQPLKTYQKRDAVATLYPHGTLWGRGDPGNISIKAEYVSGTGRSLNR